MPSNELTARQLRFVKFYLNPKGLGYRDARMAAQLVGYKKPELEGLKLLENRLIKATIDAMDQAAAELAARPDG